MNANRICCCSDNRTDEEFIEDFKKLIESIPSAIDFIHENCKDARWDCVANSMNILKTGFERKFSEN